MVNNENTPKHQRIEVGEINTLYVSQYLDFLFGEDAPAHRKLTETMKEALKIAALEKLKHHFQPKTPQEIQNSRELRIKALDVLEEEDAQHGHDSVLDYAENQTDNVLIRDEDRHALLRASAIMMDPQRFGIDPAQAKAKYLSLDEM